MLFKENNNAGMKIVDLNSEKGEGISDTLKEAVEQNPEISNISIDKINKENTTMIEENNQVNIGPISAVKFLKDEVKVIDSPKIGSTIRPVLDSLLKFMNEVFFEGQPRYRSNIMLFDPKANTLRIKASDNMDGDDDETLTIDANAGVAGAALKSDSIVVADLTADHCFAYHPIHAWPELKSIFSIPIHDSEGTILGILNFDTNNRLQETRFKDELFKKHARLAAGIFAKIIQGEEQDKSTENKQNQHMQQQSRGIEAV